MVVALYICVYLLYSPAKQRSLRNYLWLCNMRLRKTADAQLVPACGCRCHGDVTSDV